MNEPKLIMKSQQTYEVGDTVVIYSGSRLAEVIRILGTDARGQRLSLRYQDSLTTCVRHACDINYKIVDPGP